MYMYVAAFRPGELASQSLYQQLLDFCHQISAGMTYLSDKAFVHRDIAARNILLSGKTCKVCIYQELIEEHSTNYSKLSWKGSATSTVTGLLILCTCMHKRMISVVYAMCFVRLQTLVWHEILRRLHIILHKEDRSP